MDMLPFAFPSPTQETALDGTSALAEPKRAHELLLAMQTALLGELAAAADSYVRQNIFTERMELMAWNTVRKEIVALSNFMTFLGLLQQTRERAAGEADMDHHLGIVHLAEEPRLWTAISFGLVKLFLKWLAQQGYAVKTINDHLDVIKLYARLAQQAGAQTADQMLAIKSLARIRGDQAQRMDAQRPISRIGSKKADPTFLSRQEFTALLTRPDTPQGWRDRVAILLMYDLSLRPSEVVSLTLRDVNMEESTIRITRHKTSDRQRGRLKDRLFYAMQQYLRRREDTSPDAPLLVRSRKNGTLVELIPRDDPATEQARRGGRRPSSPNHRLYLQRQRHEGEQPREAGDIWTPPMTTRALREHLHEIGLDIALALYGEQEEDTKVPRTRRPLPGQQINLTSYDGRHEWTRSAIRGGSDPITVAKAGGWKGHSPMVMRYFGELEIINDTIRLER